MKMGDFTRWMYRGHRPNSLARFMNRLWALVGATGIAQDYIVTLEVPSRRSGCIVTLPLVMVVLKGQRYLVSMLGEQAQWVRNVQAAGGRATLHCGRREGIRLEEVPPAQRPPILRAYLRRAPGARPHIPVSKDAPLADFARIAGAFPVFRVSTLS